MKTEQSPLHNIKIARTIGNREFNYIKGRKIISQKKNDNKMNSITPNNSIQMSTTRGISFKQYVGSLIGNLNYNYNKMPQ